MSIAALGGSEYPFSLIWSLSSSSGRGQVYLPRHFSDSAGGTGYDVAMRGEHLSQAGLGSGGERVAGLFCRAFAGTKYRRLGRTVRPRPPTAPSYPVGL